MNSSMQPRKSERKQAHPSSSHRESPAHHFWAERQEPSCGAEPSSMVKNSKKRKASLPDDGHLEFRVENNEVLVAGFGRKVMLLVIFLESTLRLS